MSQSHRLDSGGRIDRSRPLGFTFNGKRYQGYAGDTLASALLANGVHLIGRSFKYHRPRGILSAGAEEPNALVQLETGAYSQPNIRATQIELYDGLTARSINAWPSVRWDMMAVNNRISRLFPAGFYYKTFMWPRSWWMTYEKFIRRAAGLGRAPAGADPDRYERANIHCDVLVVGAGPAGLAAALAAGRTGARVVLADQLPELGGSLLDDLDESTDGWRQAAIAELSTLAEVTRLTRTVVTGYFDHNFLIACESVTDHLGPGAQPHLPRLRLWRIRAGQVVLASGAYERAIGFQANDLPGVMLAGSIGTYQSRYGVVAGRRVVFFTNNDSAYGPAKALAAMGAEVKVADVRAAPGAAAHAAGIEVMAGHALVAARGERKVQGVMVKPLDEAGRPAGDPRYLACDLVGMSGGWSPAVHLFSQSQGKLDWRDADACFVPGAAVQATRVVGAANGTFGLGALLVEAHEAGAAAAGDAGFSGAGDAPALAPDQAHSSPLMPYWSVPGKTKSERKQFIDFQNDVTVADIRLANREGYRSVEHLKRYTTLGMGTDQGKLGNVPGLAILAEEQGVRVPDVGTTTFRPPFTPLNFGAMAGRDVGEFMDPARRTPMHHLHESAGAVFEDVGQWKRPFYYPQAGEGKHEAVNRECLAARQAVAVLDATTLGKIDLQGPDVPEFLNRIYTNAWKKLEVGRCRYGLMLGEDGMVMDDGVTSRLGDAHFLMTTTTGNAARVLSWLEEWLQTEWPELKVYANSVTEQYAVAALCGPKARDLLRELTDVDLNAEGFPFMSWKDGTVAGIRARVFRISFSGELSYEINVPASYGPALWQTLMGAGEKYGITPYGTEAMHVLRAEKGYIIVGQDTDGTVTPLDLGLDRIVSKTKDFIGKRSLSREDTARPDRKQLVGLLTDDPGPVLPEGGQIVDEVKERPPMATIGHVTSSYHSANLGRSIALALVKDGRRRMGDTVHVPQPLGGPTLSARIAGTVFIDPDGSRLHG